MFELSRPFCGKHGIVAAETQESTLAEKQRDVYETHRHRIFSLSYYMTANESEAEGILTDTFVGAFGQAPVPDRDTVDRALLEELERRFTLREEPAARAEAGAALGRSQVRRTDLEEAVATLPGRERLIFLLRDVEGYEAEKVAALLRCEPQQVQITLISARIRMRNALGALRRRATGNSALEEESVRIPECA